MEWQRFKTTRMYLHPPKSERLITLWREGKVMFGEIEAPINKPYSEVRAAGIWFVDADGNSADFKESAFEIREDGIPIHKLHFNLGNLAATMECACDFDRRPSVHIKLSVKSKNGDPVLNKIGFILRSGKENDLIFSAPDVYAIYDPNVEEWTSLPSDWSYDGIWRSGDYFLCSEHRSFDFDPTTGISYTTVTLEKDEEASLYFTLGKNEPIAEDFESVKEKALYCWQTELNKINKLPKSITNNKEKYKEIKNLAVQLLQCFCYGVGTNSLYSRQGGLQRRVWTYEAMPVLTALDRIGDFADYIEPVIDVYFNEFYEESGEIVPLGIHWAMATGTILNSFGRYSISHGIEFYQKYRDKAMRSFEWIGQTRRAHAYDGAVSQSSEHGLTEEIGFIDGLFPPMSCCDDPLIFQSWLTTDCNNVLGLRAFAEAAELFGDERAAEIRKEYESYKQIISDVFESLKANAEDETKLEIPYTPSGNNKEVEKRFAFSPSIGFLVDAITPTLSDLERIINYYTSNGQMRGGLYDKMPKKDPTIPGVVLSKLAAVGYGYIWYVCAQEYGWFNCFMRHGAMDKCREIIQDAERYAMSDEYYMLERYHQADVWYAPWSPNASCNGRMINMLLDYYS